MSEWPDGKPKYSPKQAEFLSHAEREVFYGGAARGGKTVGLLSAALQYVDLPGYSAIILRRTLKSMEAPGQVIPLSIQMLHGKGPVWNGQKYQWRFGSGTTLSFGYIENEKDLAQHMSSSYHFIGFEEATEFTDYMLTRMMTRLSRSRGSKVPMRIRLVSNPGGEGHDMLKARYVTPKTRLKGAVYIPATVSDNPFVDQEDYRRNYDNADEVTRQQMLYGNWDVDESGGLFQKKWFSILPGVPAGAGRSVRCWDMAATPKRDHSDPDWTVGLRATRTADGLIVVEHMERFRETPSVRDQLMLQAAQSDGKGVAIREEQEGGSAGPSVVAGHAKMLLGWDYRGQVTGGSSKLQRAQPLSASAQNGFVKLVEGDWNRAFLDELAAFPRGAHDDIVDAASMAHEYLTSEDGTKAVMDLWHEEAEVIRKQEANAGTY